jgi:lipid-binding SYLF domain-containing protein
MKLVKYLIPLLMFSFLQLSVNAQAENKEETKITGSINVLNEFVTMKGEIPSQLLKISEGFIIIPGMKNAGFVVGGKLGKGIAVIKNEDGSWSNPVFVTLAGGSIGFQIGVQSVDLVLVFKKRKTLEDLDDGDFTIGGDLSAAAGPVGKSSTASTDYKMEAEIYSYSRAKGLFAGITINGSSLSVDDKANERFYGEEVSAEKIFNNDVTNDDESVNSLKKTLSSLSHPVSHPAK